MKSSISTRLLAMFAFAALLTFLLMDAALFQVLKRELMRHEDGELTTNLQNMQYSIERVGTTERWARVQAKMDTLTPRDGSVRFWVVGDDPRFVYGTGLAEIGHMEQEADGRGSIVLAEGAEPFRTLSKQLLPFEDRSSVRLVVGVDSGRYSRTLRTFAIALALVSLVGVLLVMATGYWIARVGLRPLQRLSAEAQALQPGRLSQRLPLAELPIELSDLAAAFNGALDRLDVAYQRLEAFNADVAHELRTPLANLIGGAQVALSRQRTAKQFQEALQSNLEELERMRSIINDMLFLARADQGEAATSRGTVSVQSEVKKTIEFFEFVLDEMQMVVTIEGDVNAQAPLETALFRRAMSNLLQNAVEHSKPGAVIVVRIAEAGAFVRVTVENPGEPIAGAHLERLFDRFYRVDVARQGNDQHHGHGLGLAIVKAVAVMHGGSVCAASQEGITTLGFSVPQSLPG
jgi:two-component system heavy metal sensor histidine kinase CusS